MLGSSKKMVQEWMSVMCKGPQGAVPHLMAGSEEMVWTSVLGKGPLGAAPYGWMTPTHTHTHIHTQNSSYLSHISQNL